jgi:hypothetical protein
MPRLEQVEMRGIKAVFLKSLLVAVIRIIHNNLLDTTAKATEHPTWGAIQISVLS